MEQRHKTEMLGVLDALVNKRSFVERAVFLFGHCNATEEMADWLLARGVSPAAILDNSVSKQGLSYRDIPIAPPETIRGYTAEGSAVLIASRFFAEMAAQLRRLGYDGEIVQAADYDSFSEYSLAPETVSRKYARMRRGAKTLARIRSERPEDFLVVCPYNALGDAYWALAFLPAYQAKQGIGAALAVVTGEGCRQVAEIFGMPHIVALSGAEMDDLVQALIFTRAENCLIAHHDRPYTDNIIKYLDKRFLSFIDYYRLAVYGLPSGTEPAAPTDLRPYNGPVRLVKGKTVVLAPYARSVAGPPAAFWEDIAAQWRREGYLVCTNITGEEQAVRGTVPLRLPLSQIISAAEYAGRFVGLRSGLCDVLTTARLRKTVVFPDCFYSATPFKTEEFFALPGWEKELCSTCEK
ncbi:MAG: hypothetical protein LBK56_03215 [Gracilibacteraceae bacterium]|jgi:hypothetical protein|nr:hypothetical protein [Gracilibacteraceae bacterium]